MERIFSYAGTVEGLALRLESYPWQAVVNLSKEVHDLDKLMAEFMPEPTAEEWKLIDDKSHDDI